MCARAAVEAAAYAETPTANLRSYLALLLPGMDSAEPRGAAGGSAARCAAEEVDTESVGALDLACS